MTANPYGLPKTVVHVETGETRVVRTAVDYQNLLARGYADVPEPAPKAAPVAKTVDKAPAGK